MATLGKTATPNSSTHGWISSGGKQVGMQFTVPSGGGIFTQVHWWAAGDGSNTVPIFGVIWRNSDGAVLFAAGAVNTTGGHQSSPGGSGQWYSASASGVFIAGGTVVFIGWQPNNGLTVDWAYNGGDHSPDAQQHSASGSPSSFSGHTTESPNGAVAAYATYTPVSVPTVSSFSPSVGPVGTSVTILGTQFTLASAVKFNGVSASFTINSDTSITATVPAGATTGPISVTNPDGTGSSAQNFIVGSVYGDNASAFVGGVLAYGDNGTSWVSGAEVWVDDGGAWHQLL